MKQIRLLWKPSSFARILRCAICSNAHVLACTLRFLQIVRFVFKQNTWFPKKSIKRLTVIFVGSVMISTASANEVSCHFGSSSIHFGGYDVFSVHPTDSVGNVRIQCSGNGSAAFSVSLNSATNPRRLVIAGEEESPLYYNLYLDAAHTMVWGDGNHSTNVLTHSGLQVINTAHVDIPIYGRLFPGQHVAVGYYTDTIIMTLNY